MLLAGTGVELIMVERALRERGCLDEREVCASVDGTHGRVMRFNGER